MDDKLIIEKLAQAVKDGRMALDQIPEQWRVKVEEIITLAN